MACFTVSLLETATKLLFIMEPTRLSSKSNKDLIITRFFTSISDRKVIRSSLSSITSIISTKSSVSISLKIRTTNSRFVSLIILKASSGSNSSKTSVSFLIGKKEFKTFLSSGSIITRALAIS